MPLNNSCTAEALSENIRKLVTEEKMPLDQALAVARSTLERACEREGKPVPKKK